MDRNKIMKMVVILAAIAVIAGSISKLVHRDSLTLTEYANLHASSQTGESEESEESSSLPSGSQTEESQEGTDSSAEEEPGETEPSPSPEDERPVGVTLNGSSMADQRTSLDDDFYYEPLSDKLMRYMAGNSYPGEEALQDAAPEITQDELRYVHILHYDFQGVSREGELICNEYIAQDLTEIFYELYRNEYRLERVLLIDEYGGDDDASMEDNNTSCFNYRPITNSASLSMHAYGLAVDINPLYNPYVAYQKDGSQEILPASAQPYADRDGNFPYKIDENDLCYKLFTQHGFIWGGNWNNLKDYQHFQKTKP